MSNSTHETYVNGNTSFTIGEQTTDISSMLNNIDALTSLPHVYYINATIDHDNAGSQMSTYWNDEIGADKHGILMGVGNNPNGTYLYVYSTLVRNFVMFVKKDSGVEFMHMNPNNDNSQYTNTVWKQVIFKDDGNYINTDGTISNISGNLELQSDGKTWPQLRFLSPSLQTGSTCILCGINANANGSVQLLYTPATGDSLAYGGLTMTGKNNNIEFDDTEIRLKRNTNCTGSFKTTKLSIVDTSISTNGFVELHIGATNNNTNDGFIGYSRSSETDRCIYLGTYGIKLLQCYRTYTRIYGNLNVTGTVTQNASNTITHYCPIEDGNDLTSYEVGKPVFMTGRVYTRVEVTTNADNIEYEWKPSTVNDSSDCICSVKPNGSWKEFVGIVTSIDYDEKCLKFATHGDYIFVVTDSSKYEIGDMICYDGSVINDDTVITSKLMRTIIGIVSAIIDGEHVAIFKE